MTAALFYLFTLLPVLGSTALAVTRLGIDKPAAQVAAGSVLVWSQILLAARFLSAIGELHAAGFIIVHWVVAIAVWLALRGSDRAPKMPSQRADRYFGANGALRALDVRLLATLVAGGYLVLLAVGILAAPNTWDSMTYHMARVAHWIQNETLAPYPTPNLRQIIHPQNAEIGILWAALPGDTDRFASMVQWTAALVGGCCIFGISRLLGHARAAAAFAALLWLSFPEVLLQSVSTKNDVTTAAFCLATVYLLFLGKQEKRGEFLVLAFAACGLAIGTKMTAILVAPVLLGVCALAIFSLTGTMRSRASLVVAATVLFVALGAPTFLSNLREYGHPIGPSDYTSIGRNKGMSMQLVVTNVARYAYSWFDLTGIPPPLVDQLSHARAELGEDVFGVLHIEPLPAVESTTYPRFRFDPGPIRPHIDMSWFGPLGVLLIVAAIVALVRGIRRRDALRLVLLSCCGCFLLAVSYSLGWNPWAGRHFVLLSAFAAPLAGDLWSDSLLGYLMRWCTVAVAAVVVPFVVLTNASKPLVGPNSVMGLDRIGQQSLNNPLIEEVLRRVDRDVPDGATIAWIGGGDDWEYPIFGRPNQRRVVAVVPPYGASLRSHRPDFLVARSDMWTPSEGFGRHVKVGKWTFVDLRDHAWDAPSEGGG